jgi:hypothetical protein
MGKYFSERATWPTLLRFPLMFGSVLICTAYGLINFKQIFSKNIEASREKHIRLGHELLQRSKDNNKKQNTASEGENH